MSMKRLVLFSVAWWMLIAVEVGTVGAIPGLASKTEHGFVLTTVGIVVHFALTALVSGALAFGYVRRKGKPDFQAFPLAVSIVITGLALDALLTVPLFVKDFGAYFGKWTVWAGYVLAFGVVAAVGNIRARSSMVLPQEGIAS